MDPVLLLEAGATIGERVEDDRTATVTGAATLAGFYAISVPLFVDARWTRPIWRLVGAKSGKDWMLNSGVFAFDYRSTGRRANLVSAAIFATYPLWLAAGILWGRRRRRMLSEVAKTNGD
ncbi:MAG: hypothetical protein DCC49_02975 [Acidobacteria bacterium]|nr:MAG: hypothetical protein DCC49_02975 [Acidobacteriota bacterium]